MGTGDGSFVSSTKVVDHGNDKGRWTIVILGDGFRAPEMGLYHQKVTDLVNGLQGIQPFGLLWNRINVHRIDVHSVESGADDPAACGGPGTTKRTYFDATFCGDGQIRRTLLVDDALAITTVDANVSRWEAIVVLVNSTVEGGTRIQKVATMALFSDNLAMDVAHELGHVLGLTDEYDYLSHCPPGDIAGQDTYTDGERFLLAPNVTTVTDRSKLKWRHKLAKGAVPRMDNPDCTKCDLRPNPFQATTVGLFEGAHHFRCGVFRPQYDCMMRTQRAPFCRVCSEAITQKIIMATAVPSCFLATAVYGDPGHPDVVWLRNWRDRQLARGVPAGPAMRALVAAYDRLGPPLARFTVARPRLARLLRERAFGPAVAALRRRAPPDPPTAGDGA